MQSVYGCSVTIWTFSAPGEYRIAATNVRKPGAFCFYMKLYFDKQTCKFEDSLNGRYLVIETDDRVAVESFGERDYWLDDSDGVTLIRDNNIELK